MVDSFWEGSRKDNQLEIRESFWKLHCPFCPDEIMAEEFINCHLPLDKMIDRVSDSGESPRKRKFLNLKHLATPTLIIGSNAIIGSEGFTSDFDWLRGVLNFR